MPHYRTGFRRNQRQSAIVGEAVVLSKPIELASAVVSGNAVQPIVLNKIGRFNKVVSMVRRLSSSIKHGFALAVLMSTFGGCKSPPVAHRFYCDDIDQEEINVLSAEPCSEEIQQGWSAESDPALQDLPDFPSSSDKFSEPVVAPIQRPLSKPEEKESGFETDVEISPADRPPANSAASPKPVEVLETKTDR
jgi:hypothetical protein